MSETFICALTEEPCFSAGLCRTANEPLQGAVTLITKEVKYGPGTKAPYASAALITELGRLGRTLNVAITPTADYTDATICPRQIIELGLRGHTSEAVAKGVAFMTATAVESVITDLNLQYPAPRRS